MVLRWLRREAKAENVERLPPCEVMVEARCAVPHPRAAWQELDVGIAAFDAEIVRRFRDHPACPAHSVQ